MYSLFRPLLFRLDPERSHALTLYALRSVQAVPPALWLLQLLHSAPAKPVQAFGLTFKNPVGLAAGYDKDGVAIRGLAALGFGHVEIGTVTPRPQAGNPKPRVFRLLEDEAVINRMGFPGGGSERMLKYLNALDQHRTKSFNTRIGINLGKNKDTPNEEAVLDYLALLQIFAPYGDYLTINISSPNTVGLRQLQGRAALEALLTQLDIQRKHEEKSLDKHIPLLVKLAPDLSEQELEEAVGVILQTRMDGIIATNTTLAREGLRSGHQGETGGLSGSPLRGKSEAVLRRVVQLVDGRIPVVSAGGVMSPDDAKQRLALGASLVQLYTGLIYRGPGLVRAIVRSL